MMSTLQLDPRAELSIAHFANTIQTQIWQVIDSLAGSEIDTTHIKPLPLFNGDKQRRLFILCQEQWYVLFSHDQVNHQITVLDVWSQEKFQRLRHLYWPQAAAA